MRNIRRLAFVLLALCPVWVLAEETVTTQNFDAMAKAGTLTFTNSNKTGTTDFVTYTCSGHNNIKFAYNISADTYYLYVDGSSSAIVTTTAIADLKKVAIGYDPGSVTNMTFYYSTDNSNWVEVTADGASSGGNRIYIMPASGTYYLKLKRGSTSFNLLSVTYTTEPSCNCLRLQLQDN